jgi:plastocyanin
VVRKSIVLAAVLIAIPLALAACGDDEDETTAAEETAAEETTGADSTADSGAGSSISISETEFALDPDAANAAAGPVTIEVSNDGNTVHNLEVEGEGVEEVTTDLEPGASDTLELELVAGTYEMYCNIGDHADQGMVGELTVE